MERIATDDDLEWGWISPFLKTSRRKPLTPREIETLDLLRRGFSNKDIAQVMEISENTAKFHVKAILAKLQAVDRAEAVAVGFERGLLQVD